MLTFSRASAPARVCLAGENVDWLAGPVMTATLADLRTEVLVSEGPDGWVDVRFHLPDRIPLKFSLNDRLSGQCGTGGYIGAAIRAVAAAGARFSGLRLMISSTVPVTGGLASSGALCVAAVAALARHAGLSLSSMDLAALAYSAERYGMGIECGQMDQYAIAVGGVLLLVCSSTPPLITKFSFDDDIRFIVGTTEQFSPFAGVVDGLKRRWQTDEPGLARYVERTVQAIRQAELALAAGAPLLSVLGEMLNECQDAIERDKRVRNPALGKLIAAARDAGAIGAKSTGAREKGGSMFAVVQSDQTAEVVRAIVNAGGTALVSAPDRKGINYDLGVSKEA